MTISDYFFGGLITILAFVLLLVHTKNKLKKIAILWSLIAGLIVFLAGNELRLLGVKIGTINNSDPLFTFIYALFAIGVSKQLLQFLFFRLVIFPDREFTTSSFGLIHCLWISLGTISANLIIQTPDIHPINSILIIFGQIFTAVMSGYFFTMAKFTADSDQNFRYLNTCLASTIIVQGLIEFFMIAGQTHNLIVLLLGTGFLSITLLAHLFRQEKGEYNRKS